MALIPFACAINNIYGTQAMLNFGMRAQFMRIIIASSFFNIVILVPHVLFRASGGGLLRSDYRNGCDGADGHSALQAR